VIQTLMRLAAAIMIVAAAGWAQKSAPGHFGHPVMDNKIYSMFLADRLEHAFDRPSGSIRFDGQSWIGGDYNRIWINTEGTRRYNGGLEDTDVQVLYGRLVAPFWDLQGGLRYYRPEPHAPSRAGAVFGVQGLAPQWFEVQAATFISHKGEVAARAEVDYDILITQRLVAQPRIETNLSFQNVPELGIGRGINDAELGVRVRYEIRREFAPYIGLAWTSKFGQTAAFARSEAERVRGLSVVIGIRVWR
jgi:copper resistance protein B